MRILLLNQYYAPDEASTAQLLSDIGAGLAAAGHEVRAVTSTKAYADPQRSYPAEETIGGVRIRRVWASSFGRASRLGRVVDYATFLAGAALALLREPRPDVVVSLSTPPMVAALGTGYARLSGARAVYWVMDVYPDLAYELGVLERGALVGRLLSLLSRTLLRAADRVVVLGETMAERVLTPAGARGTVVHNWADESVIRPRPTEGHPLRERWGWGDRFVVLYSGNMGLAHEFDTLLDAAAQLRGEPVLFSFVGGGPRREAVRREAERRGLDNVEFRGYVPREELGVSLTAPDVHLVTLRDGIEGLLVPSKIYGVLAAGRPTLYVGPARGEIHEILASGNCGRRCAVGDADGLADLIRGYLDAPDAVEAEGQRARVVFERRFTKARAIDAFIRLVRQTAA